MLVLALLVELVDTLDLDSSTERYMGPTPIGALLHAHMAELVDAPG